MSGLWQPSKYYCSRSNSCVTQIIKFLLMWYPKYHSRSSRLVLNIFGGGNSSSKSCSKFLVGKFVRGQLCWRKFLRPILSYYRNNFSKNWEQENVSFRVTGFRSLNSKFSRSITKQCCQRQHDHVGRWLEKIQFDWMARIILSHTFAPRVKHVLFVARIAFPRVAVSAWHDACEHGVTAW